MEQDDVDYFWDVLGHTQSPKKIFTEDDLERIAQIAIEWWLLPDKKEPVVDYLRSKLCNP